MKWSYATVRFLLKGLLRYSASTFHITTPWWSWRTQCLIFIMHCNPFQSLPQLGNNFLLCFPQSVFNHDNKVTMRNRDGELSFGDFRESSIAETSSLCSTGMEAFPLSIGSKGTFPGGKPGGVGTGMRTEMQTLACLFPACRLYPKFGP